MGLRMRIRQKVSIALQIQKDNLPRRREENAIIVSMIKLRREINIFNKRYGLTNFVKR